MLEKQIGREKRTSRVARRTGVALVVSLVFVASACANSPNPCGNPPVTSVNQQIRTFRDPYTQRKHFERSVAEYRAAVARNSEEANLRDAKWRVCINAQGLAPYTREVASDIRPRFSHALATVISITRTQSDISEPTQNDVDSSVEYAVAEFSSAMPRFWRSPAASLRGRRQPGNPLNSHY